MSRVLRPALALSLLVSSACVTEPPVEIGTHVDDWRDEIIYQVMVDRFANGDRNNDARVDEGRLGRYQGGDWQGIIDQLDYIEALGVTSLWISPAVKNVEEDAGFSGYHGYWTQNFMAPNPHFGDMAKLRELTAACHERGITVILDIVTNHIGQAFYYDINGNGQPDDSVFGYYPDGTELSEIRRVSEWDPAYDPRGVQGFTSLGEFGPAPVIWVNQPEIGRTPPMPPVFQNLDWYNRRGQVTDWGVREQVLTGDFPGGLKDIDTTHPDAVDALVDVFTWWIEQTDIDGFRIDTLKHVEYEFWTEFCPRIRQNAAALGKDNFFMFGEAFDGDDVLLGSYAQAGMVDSVFYFSQKFQIYDDVFKYGRGTTPVQNLLQAREVNYYNLPQDGGVGSSPQELLVNFIDNHDVPRFLYEEPSVPALRSALTYLMTQDGIPCLYYGTEQGFDGGNDPGNREPLWWAGYDTSNPLFTHTADLTRLRRAYLPLRRGDFQIRWVTDRMGTEEDAGILAFQRTADDGSSALVVINTHDDETSSTSFEGNFMPVEFDAGTRLVAVFPRGIDYAVNVSDARTVQVEVAPREGLVLVPESEVVAY